MKKIILVLISLVILTMLFAQIINSNNPLGKKFVTSDGLKPRGLFAPGVIVGKTLYISGKGDYRPKEDITGKTRNCLNEVRKVLKMAGMDMENVVQVWVYLQNLDNYDEMNKVYAEFFPKNQPARTTLGVTVVPGDSEIEITCIAYSDLSERKVIGTPPANLPFSQGVLAGNTLYISGKGDHLSNGSHPKTFEEQVRQAMRNVSSVLKEAGLDFSNVVMSHVYIDNYDNYGVVNKIYSEFFEYGNEPARATVFVDGIPGGSHIEITCIATRDLTSRKIVRPHSMKFGPEEMALTASPGVWAGDMLYLSVQSGFIPGEGIITVDLEKQFRQMIQNQLDVLHAAGLEFTDIVSGNVYLRNINDYELMNELYKQYFTVSPAVRTTLQSNYGYEKNDVRVKTSFIATRPRK